MSRTSARLLRARQREEQALDLRLGGATYAQIAEALGMTSGGAYKAVMRALVCLAAETEQKAETLRRIEYLRLERMHLGLWGRAKSGDEKAVHAELGIAKRRSELLGLDRKPRPEPLQDDEPAIVGRQNLGATQIATAMDETLQRYRAGRIDADQAHQELEILKGQLQAAELTVFEERLAALEAQLGGAP